MAKEKISQTRYYHDGKLPPKVRLTCVTPSKTRQSEKESSDINVIVKRIVKQGIVSLNSKPGLFLDVSEMGDYRDAVEQVRQGEEFFMALPSGVRTRFDNDAATFLDFVSNPVNRDEMQKLGLLGEVPEAPSTASPEASSGS